MARVYVVALIVVAGLIACAAGAEDGLSSSSSSSSSSSALFYQENPIRQVVTDGLRELETSVLQALGNTRHAISFARFAHR